MERQGRVLVVDDLEQWRTTLVTALQREGYFADSVATSDEVISRMEGTFYHLLLLDIQLDNSDVDNVEGLALLRELGQRRLSEAIKVIMLSVHDTKEYMIPAYEEYGVIGFLPKDEFTKQKFLESVRRAFSEKMNINRTLEVHWQQVNGPEEVVLNLKVNGVRLKQNPALQSLVALELDDLLCRLFDWATSILVRPWTSGMSGTGVLLVQPFSVDGGGHPVIVKFGDFRKIEEEHANFEQYVHPFVGGARNTDVHRVRRTPRLGGIEYSLLGAQTDHLEDFGDFYRHATISQTKDMLEQLFRDTCGVWYANSSQLQPLNLTADYQQLFGFTLEKLAQALAELWKSVQVKQKLYFKSLQGKRAFTNPLHIMTGPPFIYSTYTCTTHGDFNQHNLLVDNTGHTWLIDFHATGRGHILRDVAELDSVIRFVLLAAEEATLEERLKMEEALCSAERFSQVERMLTNLPTENQLLSKAYTAVVHLRTLARQLVARNPSDDISEYYIALFYNAVNTLRFYALPSEQREHALLCASLLADRLIPKG